MAEHNEIGKKGEELALTFLKEKGYQILAANWRYHKTEIDLIAIHNKQLIIVEVKTRTSIDFESPKEAVTFKKQRNIIRAADAYIQENNIDLECQFDIVSILIQGKNIEIEHIPDAFYPML